MGRLKFFPLYMEHSNCACGPNGGGSPREGQKKKKKNQKVQCHFWGLGGERVTNFEEGEGGREKQEKQKCGKNKRDSLPSQQAARRGNFATARDSR